MIDLRRQGMVGSCPSIIGGQRSKITLARMLAPIPAPTLAPSDSNLPRKTANWLAQLGASWTA